MIATQQILREHTLVASDPAEEAYLREGFSALLPLQSDMEARLRGVLKDTLAHPGSLVRARLAFGILREHGVERMRSRELAIAIEYFHTASLLFDDLPCMDHAIERRGHACPHVIYGEAAAMLGALGFVNQGYALLWGVLNQLPSARRQMATQLVSECLGIQGILDGQSRDLHFADGRNGESEVIRVALGKTATLIRMTLLLPAVVAGAGEEERELLEDISLAWGLAYQVLDDFKDCLTAYRDTGKTGLRDEILGRPNLPHVAGHDRARAVLTECLDKGALTLDALARNGATWYGLQQVQSFLESEACALASRLDVPAVVS